VSWLADIHVPHMYSCSHFFDLELVLHTCLKSRTGCRIPAHDLAQAGEGRPELMKTVLLPAALV
jgi:hypothetical protein